MANHELDQLHVFNPTKQPFTVMWGGYPYTLQPGQKFIWPRFIAEHFAKRMTDAILLQREEKTRQEWISTGRPLSEFIQPNLLNSRVERPKVISSILQGVYGYHTPQAPGGRAAQTQRMIDEWNQPNQQEERVTDMGSSSDPLIGTLEDDEASEDGAGQMITTPQPILPPASEADPVAAAQTMLGAPNDTQLPPPPANAMPLPNTTPLTSPNATMDAQGSDKPNEGPLQKRNRLIREAKQLNIRVASNWTTEQLESEIKRQYA